MLQFFAVLAYESRGVFWWELVTMRAGELECRRAIVRNWDLGRRMADHLANVFGVPADDRGGLYCGRIFSKVNP